MNLILLRKGVKFTWNFRWKPHAHTRFTKCNEVSTESFHRVASSHLTYFVLPTFPHTIESSENSLIWNIKIMEWKIKFEWIVAQKKYSVHPRVWLCYNENLYLRIDFMSVTEMFAPHVKAEVDITVVTAPWKLLIPRAHNTKYYSFDTHIITSTNLFRPSRNNNDNQYRCEQQQQENRNSAELVSISLDVYFWSPLAIDSFDLIVVFLSSVCSHFTDLVDGIVSCIGTGNTRRSNKRHTVRQTL